MDTTTPSTNTQIQPWDGSPITASLFLRNIADFAAQHGWYSLLMKGYFVNRGTICTVSNDAIAAIRAHFQDANANPLPDDIQNPPSPMPATAVYYIYRYFPPVIKTGSGHFNQVWDKYHKKW